MAKTIVVPLDTSSASESSLPVATDLARKVGGDLLLVSVIEAPSEFGVWLHANETIEAWVDHHFKVDQYLTGIADQISGFQVDALVSTGNPSVEINLIARDQTEPVIVMGSHARSGFSRLAIGSVAVSVIHDANCPVIVVRELDELPESAGIGPLDRLLVALDGSEFAEEALSAAQAVLGATGLNIHLLQVVETTKWFGSTYAEIDYGAFQMYIESATAAAEEYLSGQAEHLEQQGHTVTWEVRDGLAAEHISDSAGDFNAGLIVMSTHGRTGLSRVFMGSVAERVIRDSERPVLLVSPQTGN
ncbi:universal stress protein [soil metagenome]